MNDTLKNTTKNLDELLSAGTKKQPATSTTTPKPLGSKQDDLLLIPPPKSTATQQKPKVTVPPPKPNILLMNGDTTGIQYTLWHSPQAGAPN